MRLFRGSRTHSVLEIGHRSLLVRRASLRALVNASVGCFKVGTGNTLD